MAVDVRTSDGVARVTLAWRSRRNALGPSDVEELVAALSDVARRPDVKVMVLTGDGAFCAGGDLAAIREVARRGAAVVRDLLYSTFQELPRAMLRLPVPTIAAVDGAAVGLGMDLALMCDIRFVGPSGWLRQGWAALGIIPGTGGELLLRRLAPAALWHLLATDPKIDAEAAHRLGLTDRAASDDTGPAPSGRTAVAQAEERAAELARLPSATLEAYTYLNRADTVAALDEHLSMCLEWQTRLLTSPMFLERADAVLMRTSNGGRHR
ncbi:enoyl-CoA hydratase [Pseudonocardia sulfidoxydans NBRC 16205]|uniref:Enoyl-CoA hydratase n=1 Tax=Pseudonocardia sulfidoxydans NBRC 16205 TaxID=1223511 RepID=A0A511DA03_9PSEU|nr:enoyl-CoA hydratase/isomerase family protein [Pseudonocardia sulfidoxydans]GEL21213.1 enoyl-CoA hydratase [Pseudonocardia sulfidoxydans NBRC 16205]